MAEALNMAEQRKEYVKEAINEKYNGIIPKKEILVKQSKTSAYVGANATLITSPRYQDNEINAGEIDSTLSELHIDLNAVFKGLNFVDTKVEDNLKGILASLSKTENDLEKANLLVDEYENYIMAMGNPAYKIEDFVNKSNIDKDISLYKERYNEQLTTFSTNVYDELSSSLILPKLRDGNMAYYSEGVVGAKAYLSNQICSAMNEVRSGDYSPSNVIIPNNNKMWQESIITDEPIKISVETDKYKIINGAMCELTIEFESETIINELGIEPFSEYPMDILAVKYNVSDDADEDAKYLVYKNNPNEALRPKSLTSPVIYRFNNTLLRKITIVLNQLHYERKSFIFNPNDALMNNVLFSINETTAANTNDNTIFAPNYKDRAKEDPAWALINKMQNSYKDFDIKKILFRSETENQKAIKYHYQYGLRNVYVKNNEFDRTGMYVSKCIENIGNIRKISIITDEVHPVNTHGEVITDIEYYITHASSPKWTYWKPILPKGKKYIDRELLQLYDDYCELRFNAVRVDSVLIDGSPLKENIDYFLKRNSDGNIYGIEIPNYNPMEVFTASYVPVSNSDVIEFNSNDTIYSTETFTGSGKSFFTLSNDVFLAGGEDDVYVKIVNVVDGKTVAYTNNGMEDVTDIYNINDSYANFDKKNSNYQYYVDKKYLYLNKAIDGNYKIEVTYKHSINRVRLKAILRRNSKYDKHISPVLNSIKHEIITSE